ncbi:aminopeptidase P family protein [Gammaproteobacteria bacterium]|nr:aminopeptidase P family protein [Gammaproteobacteria bacterium]
MNNRIPLAQSTLKTSQAILLFQDEAPIRSHDVHYIFHPDPDIYYLSGLREPKLWLLILPTQTIVFSRPCLEKNRLWEGKRLADACLNHPHINQWHPLDELREHLFDYLEAENISEIYTNTDLKLTDIPYQHLDIQSLTHPMRAIKDDIELQYLQHAASISAQGHNHLMQAVNQLNNEIELEGAFLNFLYQHQIRHVAYPSIVASGINACTLHYQQNNAPLGQNDLILVDAGCEYQGYAADITRTFPKNGKFNKKQQAIYEAVLDTQMRCISYLKPNLAWSDVQAYSVQVITQHLIDLGYLFGSVDDNIKNQSYLTYFPHGIGHGLGLDVHDARIHTLEPNMVVTIEPGVYVHEEKIGVRIEDMILITADGCQNLSHEAAKSVSEIEKQCKI